MRIFRTHLRSRSVALAHPEVSIRGLAVVGEVGDEEGLGEEQYMAFGLSGEQDRSR